MRRSLALVAITVFSAFSLTACGSDEEPSCYLANPGSTPTPIPCESTSAIRTTSTTTEASTTVTVPVTTTTVTPTSTTTPSPVTVYVPSPTPQVSTVTVYTQPTTATAPPPPAPTPPAPTTTFLEVGQSALCGGSRITGDDANGAKLGDDTSVAFRAAGSSSAGFSVTHINPSVQNPVPFTFYDVIVTEPGTETSFSGKLLLTSNGSRLSSSNTGTGEFRLNSAIQPDGFVFCDSPATLR